MMNWPTFKKQLKGIKFKSKVPWEMTLPHDTDRETIQKIIELSRNNALSNWHVVYSEPTDKKPKPDIFVYWA